MIRYLCYRIGLLLFFLSTSLFAAGHPFYLGVTAGASFESVQNPNPLTTYDGGKLTDTYSIGKNSTVNPIIGINAGYESSGRGNIPAIAIGVGLYDTLWNYNNYNFNGQVVETAAGDPSLTLYKYQFQVQSKRAMLEAKLSWLFGRFSPFVDVGIGSAWNHFHQYSETPIDSSGYVALPAFQAYTNNHFAYQAGLGISYVYNFTEKHVDYWLDRVSLGYRYVYSGNFSSGTRGSVYPYALKMGNLTNNEIYLGYTHLF